MPKKKYDLYENALRDMIESQLLTQKDAATKIGVHLGTVERWCKRFGLKTQRTGPKSGEKHPKWKGGRRLVGGYWYVYVPDHPYATSHRTVAEHRLVMEEKLGRYLLPTEVCHHIDGNRQNNKPDNLIVFQTNADHLRHELTGKCPNWSVDGWKRFQEKNNRVRLSPEENRERNRIRCQQRYRRLKALKSCGDRPLQTTGRQTS